MKNLIKTLAIVAVIGIALASTSSVFAQATPPGNSNSGGSNGNGRRGGSQTYQADGTQDGIVHDALITAFAEALGLSVDEVETRLADGETMSEIALSTGMTLDEFRVLLNEIHELVIDQGIMAGTMAQIQARVNFARETRAAGMFGLNDWSGMGRGLYGTNDCPYID
jgi:hypothetical protein